MNFRTKLFAGPLATLVTGCVTADSGFEPEPFEPASSVAETFRWHRALPMSTAWWDVVGEKQAWYFKNLQQLYPSVTVYRDGPVRELNYRPMAEIADFPVETPAGTMRYEDFLHSDQSTTMGMVILHKGKIVFEWVIELSGSVGVVRIKQSSLKDSSVATCIQALMRRWKFPKPQGGTVTVTYPFGFSPM